MPDKAYKQLLNSNSIGRLRQLAWQSVKKERKTDLKEISELNFCLFDL